MIDPEIFSLKKKKKKSSLKIWKHVCTPIRSLSVLLFFTPLTLRFIKDAVFVQFHNYKKLFTNLIFDITTFMKFISVRDYSQAFSTLNIQSLFITYNCIVAFCRLRFPVVFVRWWGTWIIHNGVTEDPFLLEYESSSVVNRFTTFRRKILPL
jgi:hypothetical protein